MTKIKTLNGFFTKETTLVHWICLIFFNYLQSVITTTIKPTSVCMCVFACRFLFSKFVLHMYVNCVKRLVLPCFLGDVSITHTDADC